MYGFLSLCMFLLASYLTKKLKGRRAGLIALLVGVAASALLFQAPVSTKIVEWSNANWMGSLTASFGGLIGESLPPGVVWSILGIGGFIVTLVDLRYDHTYNPYAIVALVITPIATQGSAGGLVTDFIHWVHTLLAGAVAWAVSGAVA